AHEWYGLGCDPHLERLLAPRNESLGRRLILRPLTDFLPRGRFGSIFCALFRVLDFVLRRENDDVAFGAVSGSSCAPRDLVEFPGGEPAHLLTVKLCQRREHHSANGHVNAHPERIGATDHFEEPALR